MNQKGWFASAAHGNTVQLRENIPFWAGFQDERGTTALMTAAAAGQADAVRLLLPLEGDLRDREGRGALEYAERAAAGAGRGPGASRAAGAKQVLALLAARGEERAGKPLQATPQCTPQKARGSPAGPGAGAGSAAKAAWFRAARAGDAAYVAAHAKEMAGAREGRAAPSRRGSLGSRPAAAARGAGDGVERALADEEPTALMVAAAWGHEEVCHALLRPEARIWSRSGKTALMLACEFSRVGAALALAPAEQGAQDDYGWSALMYAVDAQCEPAIRVLYPWEHGLRNAFGYGPVEIAREGGKKEALALLEALQDEERDGRHSRRPSYSNLLDGEAPL